MRWRVDLYDCGELVALDPGHDAGEAIAGRLRHDRLGLIRGGLLAEVASQIGTVHAAVTAAASHRLQPSFITPAAHGVDTHAEEVGHLARSKVGHAHTVARKPSFCLVQISSLLYLPVLASKALRTGEGER